VVDPSFGRVIILQSIRRFGLRPSGASSRVAVPPAREVESLYLVAEFSHKSGEEFILKNHREELQEIKQIIKQVDAERLKLKESREKTMPGRLLYSPKKLNAEFTRRLDEAGWETVRIRMKTTVPEIGKTHVGFREIDFVKNGLGLEVQFGKYAFMVYNILAKMTIFAKRDVIDAGVEVVPMRDLAREMSTGVSYFEQVKSDLESRGVGDIDVPVLVLGVDAVRRPHQATLADPSG
jgi:hypothetical protein